MKVLSFFTALILGIFLLCGCISSRDFTGNMNNIDKDKIILVGSIELVPPLKPGEQNIKAALNWKEYENTIIFSLGEQIVTEKNSLSNLSQYLKVKIGETFYVEQKYSNKLYISAPCIWIETTGSGGAKFLYLPGPFLIEPPSGCKVIYIGKIRYHRDIYNGITKIELIDEFDAAKQDAEKKYNTSIDMCRARLKVSG
ncbi:MAG: hypothetical protein EHM28_04465 [Spirochaetaceae bacterium]|nr:MAG: hypothetical protein EHM28_04465 [Spirochaetaceae bacterium]